MGCSTRVEDTPSGAGDSWVAALSAAQNEHKMLFAFYLLFAQFYAHKHTLAKRARHGQCVLALPRLSSTRLTASGV